MLNAQQSANAKIIIAELNNAKITNRFVHAAILSIVQKETEFNPGADETSYRNTSNARIRKIFSKTGRLTEEQLNALKRNDRAFFNFIYDGVAGNGPNDGYLYRGRGFNQITGRGNYDMVGKSIKVDLVKNPELLADPLIAARALVRFYINGYRTLVRIGTAREQYNSSNINDFKNLRDALGAMYHINAGPGHSMRVINADVTGGLAKARSTVDNLYTWVSNNTATVAISGLTLGFFLQ